MHLSGRLEA
ncbi:Protein of unknown function [Propionibacterium freudenreichii]|nr:Protein of unknown function [Propionibacterium freudenreichii]